MSAGGQGGAGTGAVVRQGHLRKLKTMKKKFFVLRAETPECSARLEYYESEKKFRSGATPRRILPLKTCYNITRRLDLKQKHVIALFTREEQFCVVAENEVDLHAWLTAIMKQHRNDDASDELLHPIQHVWQVNVQKKGLGATKNIQGLYNLCLTDKTLTLVKIKSQNNVISDLGIPERVEYSLKNIRRCGDSECFFYMEVGRQTTTGAGEIWMHSDDSNIAQSMHSTIYLAMKNCAKETENERDHIIIPKTSSAEGTLPARRQTYSDGRGRAGLANDAGTLRNRCDSMPSRACSSFEVDRPPTRHSDIEGLDASRDEADSVEWHRTPRIPEEPDFCDPTNRDVMKWVSTSMRGSSIQHSRTSSLGMDDVPPESAAVPDGYLPMAPGHDHLGGLISASSGSVCSGTPSTDPRFSEYQLEPATSHIGSGWRPPRAYSVGSRPAPRADPPRHRAYSVGAKLRAAPAAPPRASATDLMELDFSHNSHSQVIVSRTPPAPGFLERKPVDEYVDMSPRNAGYVEMRPGDLPPSRDPPTPAPAPDGYVEMNYGRAATRPIAITAARPPPSIPSSPDDRRRKREVKTPLGSQTIFPLSLDSPASPPELDATDIFEDDPPHHPLTTVREISEDGRRSPEVSGRRSPEVSGRRSPEMSGRRSPEVSGRRSPEVSSSPSYVKLAYGAKPIGVKTPEPDELSCNPMANKTIARVDVDARGEASTATLVLATVGPAARFSVGPAVVPGGVNYAALDLEPRRPAGGAGSPHTTYTQIDFLRSEKLHADVN